jgi:hypothetical protein
MSNSAPMTAEQAAHELDLLKYGVRPNTPVAQAFEAVIDLRASLRYYTDREAFFARELDVSDGGKYRNDWPGAVERLIARSKRLALDVIHCPDPSCRTRYLGPELPEQGTTARCPACSLPVILRGDHYVPAPDAGPTEAP